MDSVEMSSGGGRTPGTGSGEEKVSLEAFITSNWQILTILGVFAGITNYMNGLENTWLVTVGFLLTFIVELEILQLLLRIRNRSFLLNAFTVLSGGFIIIFASFIYSNHLASILSGFGVAVYPLLSEHRVLLLRLIFFISIMTVVLGLYRHLHSAVIALLRLLGGKDKVIRAGFLSTAVVLAAGFILLAYLSLAPEGMVPAESTITTPQVVADSTTTTSSTTTSTSTSTTTTLATIACKTNSDCGNQTLTRICYKSDVYLQKTTPLCQKPDTPEARCVYKTILEGETITQEAKPYETCSRGCKDGECI